VRYTVLVVGSITGVEVEPLYGWISAHPIGAGFHGDELG
jgi:hypothetical protein